MSTISVPTCVLDVRLSLKTLSICTASKRENPKAISPESLIETALLIDGLLPNTTYGDARFLKRLGLLSLLTAMQMTLVLSPSLADP
jgi:hypothetical protein